MLRTNKTYATLESVFYHTEHIIKYEFIKKSVEIFLTCSFGERKYSRQYCSWQEKLGKNFEQQKKYKSSIFKSCGDMLYNFSGVGNIYNG